MSNRHRDGGVFDSGDAPQSDSELNTYVRIKAALNHPNAPETIDGWTERDKSIMARHIAVRLTRGGPKK